MIGRDLKRARTTLGEVWGYGRPLSLAEMAHALRFTGQNPGETVRTIERRQEPLSGPVSALIELYLDGVEPPDGRP